MAATLYRDAALADGTAATLRVGVSILVVDDRIAWIRPSDGEEDPGETAPAILDCSGATVVPGMVDCHSHLTMPGGARWIERGLDPAEVQRRVADDNARLLLGSGVRWVRDVGSPPAGAGGRALSLEVRDAWRGRRDRPHIRAAGTWVTRRGTLPAGLAVEADDADALLGAVAAQLDDGADLVKLYLDGPDPAVSPWSVDEVCRAVTLCHARGARVTAHSGRVAGARVCAEAAVDAVEHGFELDRDVVRLMATNGVTLVSTLTVLRSWQSFGATTRVERFAGAAGKASLAQRWEAAVDAVRLAHAAGVRIAAGTDFGGGSPRAGLLAWEVEALVAAGLEPWEALAAATWRGGDLLGEPDAGRLREGGPADFFLVHGDPLSDPSALWRVVRVS